MRLAKTLTALSLVALLAMMPACSSSTKYVQGSSEGGALPASLASLKGKQVTTDDSSATLSIGDSHIFYNATAFSTASTSAQGNKRDDLSNDARLVLDVKNPAQATIDIANDFETDVHASLAILDSRGGDIAASWVAAAESGATFDLASEAAKANAVLQLETIITDFNDALDDGIAALDVDDDGTDSTINAMAGYTIDDTDGIVHTASSVVILSAAELLAAGFTWEGGTAWKAMANDDSAALAALLESTITGHKIDPASDVAGWVEAGGLSDALAPVLAQDTERLVLGTVGGQGLQYAAFGYYKTETKDGDGDITAMSSVDRFAQPVITDASKIFTNTQFAAELGDIVDGEAATSGEVTFTGISVAALEVDGKFTDLQGTAALSIAALANGTKDSETLALAFADWYDVTYDTPNTATIHGKAGVNADFELSQSTVAFETGDQALTNNATFSAQYLGDSNGFEADGVFGLKDDGAAKFDQVFDLQGAFGGVGGAPVMITP
jgi:hypothetical protein